MKPLTFCILAMVVCIAAVIAGCTTTSGTPASSGTQATAPAGSTATSSQDNLVPSPTDALPSQNVVTVSVGEKDYAGKIPVEFNGGTGQIHVKKIDVTLYRADGEVKTATIPPNKGDSVELEGTRQTDRVVVYITFDNGDYKKTNDELRSYRTRG